MQLQMKNRCGKCGAALGPDGLAYICSYECTFCADCAGLCKGSCPNCGGELVRRPRRLLTAEHASTYETPCWKGLRSWTVWLVSFGVWSAVALAATGSIYELYRTRSDAMSFGWVFAL